MAWTILLWLSCSFSINSSCFFFVNSILYSSLNIYGRLVISSLTHLVFFLSTEKPSLSIYQAASTWKEINWSIWVMPTIRLMLQTKNMLTLPQTVFSINSSCFFFVNSILYSSLNIYGRLVISSLTHLVFFLSTEKPSLSIYQAASTWKEINWSIWVMPTIRLMLQTKNMLTLPQTVFSMALNLFRSTFPRTIIE